MSHLTRQDFVFVLDLGDTENRFNPGSVAEIHSMLDEVHAAEGPKALVISATGKFWSNGLDLDWMSTEPDSIGALVGDVHQMFSKLLTLGTATVAAIGGHAFAAGAMLAMSADIRVMRSDRGFFCLPEIDIAIPFTEGMSELLVAKLPPRVANQAMTTGRRYGGEEAAALGIVDHAVLQDEVLPKAIELATELAGKDGRTMSTIKRRMYHQAVAALETQPPAVLI